MAESDSTSDASELSSVTVQLAKSAANDLMNTLALKIVIAELAVRDKTPEEAKIYVDHFKDQMEQFIALSEDADSPVGNVMTKEMHNYVRKLFTGISFERIKK